MKSINNIFEMVKADRYTADGREEIIKAREAETKDARRYKTGEISEATGLQKQPDGSWAPPKSTKYGKVTTNKEGKVGIQQTLGKGSKFEEFANEKSASRALANLTAGYNTTERSKQDPHSDKARQQKQWDKEVDKIKKENKAERRAEHASHFQNSEASEGKTQTTEPGDIEAKGDAVYNWLLNTGRSVEYADRVAEAAKVDAKHGSDNLEKLYELAKKDGYGDKENEAKEAGYSVYRDGISRNGEYREYRNGDDIIRYDQNGYDDRAEGKKYSAMESGPGGKRRFFDTLQEAAEWVKKGSPRDAAPLTGDTKIKVKK